MLKILVGIILLCASVAQAQPITNITLDHNTFAVGPGSANQLIGTFTVIGPSPFQGTMRLIGGSSALFQLKGTVLYVGPQDILQPGPYNFNVQVKQ